MLASYRDQGVVSGKRISKSSKRSGRVIESILALLCVVSVRLTLPCLNAYQQINTERGLGALAFILFSLCLTVLILERAPLQSSKRYRVLRE